MLYCLDTGLHNDSKRAGLVEEFEAADRDELKVESYTLTRNQERGKAAVAAQPRAVLSRYGGIA